MSQPSLGRPHFLSHAARLYDIAQCRVQSHVIKFKPIYESERFVDLFYHYSCRQAPTAVEIPNYIVLGIEHGVTELGQLNAQKGPKMAGTLGVPTARSTGLTRPKTAFKSSTLLSEDSMPCKSDILLDCDILALEDDDEDDDAEFSLDQLKAKGFAMGYNAFAIGSHNPNFDIDEGFAAEDISYAYFFKLKKTVRTPFTAPVPDGVARLLFYTLE